MRTAAITLGAIGVGALFLGYIEALGSASRVVHLGLFVLAAAGLMSWSFALSLSSVRRAGALLLLLSVGAVAGLALLTVHVRQEALPYALVAAPALLLATGLAFFAREWH